MYHPNGTNCSDCNYSIITKPTEIINITKTGNQLTGNFTTNRLGIYSIIINITDTNSNTEKRKIHFFSNATRNRTTKYYLRDVDATHGQPTNFGSGNDAASLLFTPPTSEEEWNCVWWIQNSIDVLPINPIATLKQANFYTWYKSNGDGFFGIQRYATYDAIVNNQSNTSTSAEYTWINKNITDLDWSMDYSWSWYWITAKHASSSNLPHWYTNATQPSYINLTYVYPHTPEIKNISNTDINILSATSQPSNINNATIILDGVGSTDLTVQMPDSSLTYYAKYDEIECNQSNCNFTQLDGELIFNLNLDSEHNITIYYVPTGDSSSSSWKTKITKNTETELEQTWKNIIKNQLYEWTIKDFKIIDTIVFIPEKRSSNAKLNIKLLDKKPIETENTGDTYQYLNISTKDLEIKEANISFRVNKSWANTRKVVLSRYNEEWTDLETKLLKVDEDYKYYKAKTPGFSYFAIREKKQDVIVENNIEDLTEEKTEEIRDKINKANEIIRIILLATLIILIISYFIHKKIKKKGKK
jgi:PGF-pre-PGF domain-containing protein